MYKKIVFGFHHNVSLLGCECSELGSVNQECGETGMCDCRVGVMGAKCDTCQENYFLEGRTGNCTGKLCNNSTRVQVWL